jgi:Peptidase A4 family/ell wall binding domain 2 (CWB2)
LAAKLGGPVLITPPASESSTLDPRVLTEIERVLPAGATVYILGGDAALSPGIDSELQKQGYATQRIAGLDEYATAIDVAEALGNPSTVFEATGLDFPDALSAVPAAIEKGGAILLTDGSKQDPETASYLSAHSNDTRYAIGGPLAAYGADPTAIPVYGPDLYGTSAAVANTFFPTPTVFGAATGAFYSDALSGGVFMGTRSSPGPVLLVEPSGSLPPSIDFYLADSERTLTEGYLFGGPAAVDAGVLSLLQSAASPMVIATSALENATLGSFYSQSLSVAGGRPGYLWTLVSGSLPPQMSLSTTGTIAGTPSNMGTFTFTVQVTDSSSPTPQTASATLSITVPVPTDVPTTDSSNWSGYAVTGTTFTSVTGTFNAPSLVSGTSTSAALGAWVGIDGANNTSLIQAGIGEYVDPSDPSEFYLYPWWEILPNAQIVVTSVAVAPGDEVTVTIDTSGDGFWGITLTDDTNGQSYTTTQSYDGPATSAEWIMEAPSLDGSVLPLAAYTPDVTFTNDTYIGNYDQLYRYVMVQDGAQVSTPSAFGDNGFSVAYGSTAPSASAMTPGAQSGPPDLVPRSSPPTSSVPAFRWLNQ